LNRAQLPFMISIISSVGLLILIFSPMLLELLTGRPLKEVYNLPLIGLLALFFPHFTTIVMTTVALTLIFAMLALLSVDTESQKSFFDLLAP
jgi:hypothetical protein